MRKQKIRQIAALGLVVAVAMSSGTKVMAASWQQNSTGWWYQEDNGAWPAGTWKWIDGKCYYFDGNGYMLANTTTPDGFQVNANGEWVVGGVVQNQGASSTTTNTSAQYPLAGMLSQLGLNYTGIVGWHDLDGWESNLQNGSRLPSEGKYYYTNQGFGSLYAFACALSGDAYQGDLFGRTDPIEVIAEANNVSYAEGQQMVNIVRDFLNSFDWKNSNDDVKASKAAELITNGARYDAVSSSGYLSGVLLNKEGGCNHYASSYQTLGRLIGLDVLHVVGPGHQFNYIKINGQWKKFDASAVAMYHSGISFTNIPPTEVDAVISLGTLDANVKSILGLN